MEGFPTTSLEQFLHNRWKIAFMNATPFADYRYLVDCPCYQWLAKLSLRSPETRDLEKCLVDDRLDM